MKKDENNSYFHARFPIPPLITFHWEVYEKCSQDFLICLKYLQDVVVETHLQVITIYLHSYTVSIISVTLLI